MEEKKGIVKVKVPTRIGFVEIEGPPEAVEAILKNLEKKDLTETNKRPKGKTIRELIIDLINERFFKEPKTITEIRKRLSSKGYNIPTSSISPVLYRDFLRAEILEKKGEKRRSYTFIFPEND